MINYRNVTDDIVWIGGSDRRLHRFENLFPLPQGVSYNSYVVLDEQITLFDTADITVSDQYLENLTGLLGDRKPSYLVILHMEPDHCSQIATVAALYPEMKLVASAQAFRMLHQFFPELEGREEITMAEGGTLQTGRHTFHFVTAPMVHWPEVLMAWDDVSKGLFCADAFGTFGATDTALWADELDFEREYLSEARRYYANIVGKYGVQVQAVLKKAAGLDLAALYPLHGPLWRDAQGIGWFLDKYQKWSQYEPEDDGYVVIYGSLYGHTESAAQLAAAMLREKSGRDVRIYDVSGTDVSELIGEVWRCRHIVLFCPTYNNGIYPPMANFLHDCAALSVQKRVFALAQNGTWAPASGKLMTELISGWKDCTIVEPMLTIKSALHEADRPALDAFVEAVIKGGNV